MLIEYKERLQNAMVEKRREMKKTTQDKSNELFLMDNGFFTDELIEEYAEYAEYADYKSYKTIDNYKGDRGTLQYIFDLLYDYDGYNDSKNLKALIDETRDIIVEQFKYGE